MKRLGIPPGVWSAGIPAHSNFRTSSRHRGAGATLTYAAHRVLTRHSMAREFSKGMISAAPFSNGKPPELDAFKKLQAGVLGSASAEDGYSRYVGM